MRLIVNLPKPFPALEQALEEEGCELLRQRWHANDIENADACLLDLPDAARHLHQTWRLKRALSRRRIPLAALDRDAPWYKGVRTRRLWLLAKLRLVDLHATHSMQHQGRFGAPSLYLPNAAWRPGYNLRGRELASFRDPANYARDVAFLGNTDDGRYPEHRPRMEFLRELQRRLAAEDISLEMFDSTRMSVDDQVRTIQESRINLNIGAAADNGGERSWGLPERCYGIPACGGFLLSDQRRHAADDFAVGREWVDFDTLENCVEKTRAALADFAVSRDIADAAHCRVMREHSYTHRARTLMAAIEDWRFNRMGKYAPWTK